MYSNFSVYIVRVLRVKKDNGVFCVSYLVLPSSLPLTPFTTSSLPLGLEFEDYIHINEAGNFKFNFLKLSDPYHAYCHHQIKDILEGVVQEAAATEQAQMQAQMHVHVHVHTCTCMV